MVRLKTKSEKHAKDNEKRCKSLKEREKAKFNQSQIIKNALSNSGLCSSSKKVIFSDEENDADAGGSESKNVIYNKKDLNGNRKSVLFHSSESENEDFEIKEKTQFRGKKGFELLDLQSTYGNDERFKIDERFLEDEKDNLNEDQNRSQNGEKNFPGEKAKQLKILGDILGTPIPERENEKKVKKRTHEMIRYDASKKEHEIFEIKTPTNTGLSSIATKRKQDRKRQKTDNEDLPKPKVSKEKFYKVSNEIKNQFKDKQEGAGQFSLLQTYGLNDVEQNEEVKYKDIESEENSEGDFDMFINEENVKMSDEQNKNKKEDKELNEKSMVAKGIWKESFFFVEDDERFKEALQFINKKNSDEALEVAENYDKTRKTLKEILRLHLKKQMHNRDPFKNKVGGMNKKQLATSKFKNSKMMFNKRKPFKKNLGGKI